VGALAAPAARAGRRGVGHRRAPADVRSRRLHVGGRGARRPAAQLEYLLAAEWATGSVLTIDGGPGPGVTNA